MNFKDKNDVSILYCKVLGVVSVVTIVAIVLYVMVIA